MNTEEKAGIAGDIQEVQNQDQKPHAASAYFHLRGQLTPAVIERFQSLGVAIPNNGEVNLLFTEHDLLRALERAAKNPEDLPKVPWLVNILEELI